MHNILNNISIYVKKYQNYITRFETARLYVEKARYNGKGLAIYLINGHMRKNGKVYTHYGGQGNWTWKNYKKFIYEVFNG